MQMYGDEVRLATATIRRRCTTTPSAPHRPPMCAQEQGKFWEMHDGMFANQRARSMPRSAQGDGRRASVSTPRTVRHLPRIPADSQLQVAAGRGGRECAAGVSGTPALFVNGRFISRRVPVEQITSIVDDELRRHGVKTAQNSAGSLRGQGLT